MKPTAHNDGFNTALGNEGELFLKELPVDVKRTGRWLPNQFQTSAGDSGLMPLQVSEVFIPKHNLTVYIRENIVLPEKSGFSISSGQRWGMKHGRLPKGTKNVLEVAFDHPLFAHVEEDIKTIIRKADGLNREVVSNRSFTAKWALHNLENNPAEFKKGGVVSPGQLSLFSQEPPKPSKPSKPSEAPEEKKLTAHDVAIHLIKPYVVRGDSIENLRAGGMGHTGGGYSASIGGRDRNKKNHGSDKIVVTEVNGAEVSEVFSLKKIFDEIVSTYGVHPPERTVFSDYWYGEKARRMHGDRAPDEAHVGDIVMIDSTVSQYANNPKKSIYTYGEIAVIRSIDIAARKVTAQHISAIPYSPDLKLKDGVYYGHTVTFDSDEMQWYIPGVTENGVMKEDEWVTHAKEQIKKDAERAVVLAKQKESIEFLLETAKGDEKRKLKKQLSEINFDLSLTQGRKQQSIKSRPRLEEGGQLIPDDEFGGRFIISKRANGNYEVLDQIEGGTVPLEIYGVSDEEKLKKRLRVYVTKFPSKKSTPPADSPDGVLLQNNIPQVKTVEEIFAMPKAHLSELLEATQWIYDHVAAKEIDSEKQIKELEKKRKAAPSREEKLKIKKQMDDLAADTELFRAAVEVKGMEFQQQLHDKIISLSKERGHELSAKDKSELTEYVLPYLTEGRMMESYWNTETVQSLTGQLIDEFFAERKPGKKKTAATILSKSEAIAYLSANPPFASAENSNKLQLSEDKKYFTTPAGKISVSVYKEWKKAMPAELTPPQQEFIQWFEEEYPQYKGKRVKSLNDERSGYVLLSDTSGQSMISSAQGQITYSDFLNRPKEKPKHLIASPPLTIDISNSDNKQNAEIPSRYIKADIDKDEALRNRIKKQAAQQSAGIAIFYKDKILLCHHTNASWKKGYSIPKGQMEPGEDALTAAIRELNEETGIQIYRDTIDESTLQQVEHKKGNKTDKILHYYVHRIFDLDEIGMTEAEENKKHIAIKKADLQLEEVDWCGFVPVLEAKDKIFDYQLPILETRPTQEEWSKLMNQVVTEKIAELPDKEIPPAPTDLKTDIRILNAILDSKPLPPAVFTDQEQGFIDKLAQMFSADETIGNKTRLENLARTFGIERQQTVKELTELAIVHHCRFLGDVVFMDKQTVKAAFDKIVSFYDTQVKLSHRSSTSMLLQQYSTPAPISFLAGWYAQPVVAHDENIFEPTAGNGMLTIFFNPQKVTVNEIDDTRLINLQQQDFKAILKQDASQPFRHFYHTFDAVITNPPFASMDAVQYGPITVRNLDHIMALYALDTMKDDGKCAIVIGGHTTYDSEGRIQAGKNRIFISYLYKHYNVEDVININGELYSRMGTSFNIRLILINGRKTTPEGFPPLRLDTLSETDNESPVMVNSFENLYDRISKLM